MIVKCKNFWNKSVTCQRTKLMAFTHVRVGGRNYLRVYIPVQCSPTPNQVIKCCKQLLGVERLN